MKEKKSNYLYSKAPMARSSLMSKPFTKSQVCSLMILDSPLLPVAPVKSHTSMEKMESFNIEDMPLKI
jgi:hypothetical protein